MGMDEMRVMGRNTQGVKVINLKKNDEIAAIAKVEMDRDVVEVVEGEEGLSEETSTEANHSELSEAPQTGDNKMANLGEQEELTKIEEDEHQNDSEASEEDSE
jgi:DNA gyrase subunit A